MNGTKTKQHSNKLITSVIMFTISSITTTVCTTTNNNDTTTTTTTVNYRYCSLPGSRRLRHSKTNNNIRIHKKMIMT